MFIQLLLEPWIKNQGRTSTFHPLLIIWCYQLNLMFSDIFYSCLSITPNKRYSTVTYNVWFIASQPAHLIVEWTEKFPCGFLKQSFTSVIFIVSFWLYLTIIRIITPETMSVKMHILRIFINQQLLFHQDLFPSFQTYGTGIKYNLQVVQSSGSFPHTRKISSLSTSHLLLSMFY